MTARELLLLARVRRLAKVGEAKLLREQAGLSLHEIASAVDVSVTCIWRWENGRRSPQGDAALRYGALLDQLAPLTAGQSVAS